ncbi:hypothetical protein Tcan_05677 [Toxocara canis]|uniref:Uncharacterized protein n=1 Tax=Toxocara canis TaxID=6265 RepID=A0A0B2V2T6_TOXCA|nr:hypothetical protein Tcan_05677 [Toxocara canis]
MRQPLYHPRTSTPAANSPISPTAPTAPDLAPITKWDDNSIFGLRKMIFVITANKKNLVLEASQNHCNAVDDSGCLWFQEGRAAASDRRCKMAQWGRVFLRGF